VATGKQLRLVAKPFVMRPWMISQLRRNFRKYPAYYNTLNSAKTTYYVNSLAGKPMKRVKFTCNVCKGTEFKSGEVAVDHVIPVSDPLVGFPLLPDGSDDWNTFIKRLYCDASNLQVICKDCHDIKSNTENTTRRKSRKKAVAVSKPS
jgi:5-methylcytosine-specific restriction endonuclease McrA